jgi:hypothetical protein
MRIGNLEGKRGRKSAYDDVGSAIDVIAVFAGWPHDDKDRHQSPSVRCCILEGAQDACSYSDIDELPR